MHRDSDRYRLFSRRSILLGGGQAVLFAALAGRMYYLQVVESERYTTLAEENRVSLKLLAPPRGRIVDRFGRPMAVNRQNYRAMLIPEKAVDVARALDTFSNVVPLSEAETERILREVGRKRRFLPVLVRENLTWDEVARIEVNAPELGGVSIDVGESRHYPDGIYTAPVLGYVSAVSEEEMTGDPLLELPGFRIGKAGLERVHDEALRGRSGTSQVEVNALGREIRELERREVQPGTEAWLTVDLELQKYATRRLGEQSAAAVVMDAHTGDVLTLASTPTFDPNSFNRGLTPEEWRTLIGDPRSPLNNKAIAGQYAPGSTFKMAVALAALESGAVTPDSRVFCPGHVELGNATFHCWKPEGHGTMNMVDGIVQSCDVYFYEIARRTGIDRIAAMARRLGLGAKAGIDLPGEKSGLIPSRAWKKKAKGESWQTGETLLAGIGQGFFLITPLQLAVMTARLVNGGKAVRPRLTKELVPFDSRETAGPDLPAFDSLDIHHSHLELMTNAMAGVMNSPRGTAFRARIKQTGRRMGGKTGTVQVRRISKAERETGVLKNEELPWEERDHALFVGYAPVDNPRYVVSVIVEHGGGGASVAAPIARDILREVQERDPSRGRPRARLPEDSASRPAEREG